MFDHLEKYFKALKYNALDRGYFPNPTKSILIMHLQNLEAREIFVRRHGFNLGDYIGDDKSKGDRLK